MLPMISVKPGCSFDPFIVMIKLHATGGVEIRKAELLIAITLRLIHGFLP